MLPKNRAMIGAVSKRFCGHQKGETKNEES
jgi:hypothetical protein